MIGRMLRTFEDNVCLDAFTCRIIVTIDYFMKCEITFQIRATYWNFALLTYWLCPSYMACSPKITRSVMVMLGYLMFFLFLSG